MKLQRAAKKENSRSKRWHIDGVYEVEHASIMSAIKEAATEALTGQNASVESALQAAGLVVKRIAGVYAVRETTRDPNLINQAAAGALQREAPAAFVVALLGFMLWVAMSAEVAVFVAMWIVGDANPFVIVLGLLLALSGWLLGFGVGRQFIYRPPERYRFSDSGYANWFAIVIGLFGICAIALVRVGGEQEGALPAILVTSLVAFLIALFEALHFASSLKLNNLWDDMYLAQTWKATERHINDRDDGLWREQYEQDVRQIGGEAAENIGARPPLPLATGERR